MDLKNNKPRKSFSVDNDFEEETLKVTEDIDQSKIIFEKKQRPKSAVNYYHISQPRYDYDCQYIDPKDITSNSESDLDEYSKKNVYDLNCESNKYLTSSHRKQHRLHRLNFEKEKYFQTTHTSMPKIDINQCCEKNWIDPLNRFSLVNNQEKTEHNEVKVREASFNRFFFQQSKLLDANKNKTEDLSNIVESFKQPQRISALNQVSLLVF